MSERRRYWAARMATARNFTALKLKQAAQAEEAAKNQCSLFDMEYIEEIKK